MVTGKLVGEATAGTCAAEIVVVAVVVLAEVSGWPDPLKVMVSPGMGGPAPTKSAQKFVPVNVNGKLPLAGDVITDGLSEVMTGP